MRYNAGMRTTLELDDDLLQVARQLAQQQGMTMGQVISELARKALEPQAAAAPPACPGRANRQSINSVCTN